MTPTQLAGAILCLIPLAAIGAVMVKEIGWRGALAVGGFTVVITAFIAAGSYLAFGA